jgi:hypothetical protein
VNALAAVQSLVVMLLWLYVGRVMLSRWMDEPSDADMEPLGDGVFRQKPAHKYRQMAAYLGYWLVASACFGAGLEQLLPEQPKAAAEKHAASHHHQHANEVGLPGVARELEPVTDSLLVRVVFPFPQADEKPADRDPNKAAPKQRITGQRKAGDQHGRGYGYEADVPLVGARDLLDVHRRLQVDLQANAVRQAARP